MSTKSNTEIELIDGAGGVRSEPGGRAEQPVGAARPTATGYSSYTERTTAVP
jgi:hypothetical protein